MQRPKRRVRQPVHFNHCGSVFPSPYVMREKSGTNYKPCTLIVPIDDYNALLDACTAYRKGSTLATECAETVVTILRGVVDRGDAFYWSEANKRYLLSSAVKGVESVDVDKEEITLSFGTRSRRIPFACMGPEDLPCEGKAESALLDCGADLI